VNAIHRIAAVDIGTVTTRLLVADTDGSHVTDIARTTTVTHLGEGLRATGRLSEAGMERVLSVLRDFSEQIERSGAEAVYAVATSAARDAENSRELVDAAAGLGLNLRVIPGSLEARLSFTGATYGLSDDDILVDDLGGGSTELVFGSVRDTDDGREIDIEASRSVDVGSRRVFDAFLHGDPPRRNELGDAAEWIAGEMRPFFEGLRDRPRTLITLAGTGTTLSAIKQGLAVYDPARVHGSILSGADVSDLLGMLSTMRLEQRRTVVGMDPARADVIVAGALILETVMALAGVDATVVSEHDILYGMVLAAAAEMG
jgi:exopolyphosphatase/guanosine-5'-triphosphate,3'-diphosphate pyrophosphatase